MTILMNTMKTLAALAVAGLAAAAGGAQANTSIATIGITQSGTSFTFDSGTKKLSGTPLGANPGVEAMQTLKPGATAGSTATDNTPAFFSFGPISEITPVVNNGATFGGGNFTITASDAGYTTPGATLLAGYFGKSELIGLGTAATLIDFENVTYTSGSDLTAFLAANGGTSATGTFTLGLTGINPSIPFPYSGPAFPSFSGQGSTATFDATPAAVPEPGTVASFGFGGLGLLGLMVRARKARRSIA